MSKIVHKDPIDEALKSRKKLKLGIEKISLAEAQRKKLPCYRAPPHKVLADETKIGNSKWRQLKQLAMKENYQK